MPALSLEVENLSAGYGPTRVLEDISFSIPAGARLAVLGRNGMGKTTLLATLAGQTRRYEGYIRLGDSDVTTTPSAARAHKGLGYVPQTRCVFPTLTVEENLFVGLKARPKTALEEAYAMATTTRVSSGCLSKSSVFNGGAKFCVGHDPPLRCNCGGFADIRRDRPPFLDEQSI